MGYKRIIVQCIDSAGGKNEQSGHIEKIGLCVINALIALDTISRLFPFIYFFWEIIFHLLLSVIGCWEI